MNRYINIKELTTPQLLEIRRILAGGVEATAETKKAKRLKQLEAENTRFKKLNERRDIVESAGLEWDSDYFVSLDDKTFGFVLAKMKQVKTEVAIAERTRSLKIPPMISQRELSVLDTVRQGFNEIRDRRNGG